jgi:hypothetical protein
MNNLNKTARTVGALFLISNATFLIGAMAFVEPYLNAQDYLLQISANSTQVILGALLELINGVAYIGIAVLMFPILRQRFESMALGYVAFRIIEFITQLAASIVPLLLVTLSEEFVVAGTQAPLAVGELLLATRYWSFEMLSLVFSLSALMFYYMLVQTRLVPRFLSLWGLIGSALVLTNTLFEIFGIDLGVGLVTGLPMLLNELVLGGWLIVKGFSADAIIYDPAEAVVKEGLLHTS